MVFVSPHTTMSSLTNEEIDSMMEVIGAFFVDIYYNDLYLKAREAMRTGRVNTAITDAYRENVLNYMKGIKSKEPFDHVQRGLHNYYQRMTRYSTISFAEFENKVLMHFVPLEKFHSFSGADKNHYMFSLIGRIVSTLGEFVVSSKQLRRIIDDHKNAHNVTMLQDAAIDIMRDIRDEYFTQLAQQIGKNPEMVPIEIAKKLKRQIVDETKRRCEVEKELHSAMNIIKGLSAKLKEFEKDQAAALEATVAAADAAETREEIERRVTRQIEQKITWEVEQRVAKQLEQQYQSKVAEMQRRINELTARDDMDMSDRLDQKDDSSDSDNDSDVSEEIIAETRRRLLAEKIAKRQNKSEPEAEQQNEPADPWM